MNNINKLAINGGEKVSNNLESLRAMWPPVEENMDYLSKFFKERNFVSNGNKEMMELERHFCDYLDCKYFSFFASGASALHAALLACDVSYGDEVIVPSYTFSAPAFAVLRVGAIPIFADVDVDSYNIDVDDVVKLLKKFKKIKAIIAVHMNGYPAEVKKLREIADQYNVKLIEDVAQAFGASIDGKYTGTYGHIGCFSFMPSKQLASCGELGGICTDDVDILNKANSVKTYGQKVVENDPKFYYNSFSYGYNYKASPINCVFLKPQLENFKKNISVIQNNAERINKYVENNLPFLVPQRRDEGFSHVYHFCRYRCDASRFNIDNGLFREAMMEIMGAEGTSLRLYQTHPVYKQEIFCKVFDDSNSNNYPWMFNPQYIEMYKENYSDKEHPNTLKVIDNSFAVGGFGAAPNYLFSNDIVDLYLKSFEKIKNNLDEVLKYCENKKGYVSPYEGIARLSDTKGEFR